MLPKVLPSPSRSTAPRQRDERRQRWGGFVASLVLHIALGILLLALPEDEVATVPQAWEPVDIIVFETPTGEPTGDEIPALPTTPPAEETPPSNPQPAEQPPDAGSSTSKSAAPGDAGTSSDGVSLPDGSPEPTQESPRGAGGLALSGLRQHSQGDAASGAPEPKVSWNAGQMQHRTGGAVHETTSPRRRSDTSPRSLAEAGFKSRKDGRLVYRDPAGKFKAILHETGRIEFKDMPVAIDKSNPLKMGMPGMSEAIRAAQGQELYQTEKKRILEQTFELRLSFAVAFARKHIDSRLDRLYRDLLEIWQNDTKPASSRRRLLFDRWDECEESLGKGLGSELGDFGEAGSSRIDEIRTSAGQKARKTILDFIRRHLPQGTADCYSPQELDELNRRRKSRERFEPYG